MTAEGGMGKFERVNPMSNDHITVGVYAVCLIDILDQKRKLASINDIPLEASTQFIAALKDTVGVVESFRDLFQRCFLEYTSSCSPEDSYERYSQPLPQSHTHTLPPLNEAKKAAYRRIMESPLNIQQFSDTFVFYSPLATLHGDISPNPLYLMILASASAMMISLAAGHPIRGAIHIGRGVELAENNFYGPALAEAYHIENHVAQYPRIVVSKNVLGFFQKGVFSKDAAINQFMKMCATKCQQFLSQDSDGEYIVDFMGRAMRSIPESSHPDTLDAMQKAYSYVSKERTHFQSQNNDHKKVSRKKSSLAERYDALYQYMTRNISQWQS